MDEVRLRPVARGDLDAIKSNQTRESDPLNFFGFTAGEGLDRAFEANGLISDDAGTLAVLDGTGALVGTVGWFAVRHGPSTACRALSIGITLFPDHRGSGIGTAVQRAIVEYLFDTTTIERVEAATDTENIGEQRALQKAGFSREGVLRHAQFRGGAWRDLVQFSRLRGDR